MKYKEMLDLLKAGQLDEELKRSVEQDIDRQRAISDYLFDEEMKLMEGNESFAPLNENSEIHESEEKSNKENDFVNLVNRTIRKSFIKMGFIVGLVVLVAVFSVLYAVPRIQNLVFYNPSETVDNCNALADTWPLTKRATLDIATFTELFCPGMYRTNVNVISNGGGQYIFSIIQNSSYSGQYYDFSGVINKNRLTFYNDNFKRNIPVNYWDPSSEIASPYNTKLDPGLFSDKAAAYEHLDSLDSTKKYVAYVTLNSVMNYSEFASWMEKNNVWANWCKLCFENDGNSICETGYMFDYNIGFIPYESGFMFNYEKEKYPYLSNTMLSQDGPVTEEKMVLHVTSMLNYLSDQDKFLKVIGYEDSSDTLRKYSEDIKKNGLHIFGFTMIGTKDEICALRDISEVTYISTDPVQYE